jgi:hypothetical protein
MVQAAAMSGLDFTAAIPRSRHWWLKVRWILDRLEDVNTLALYRMQHKQHVAVTSYALEQAAFNTHWDAANDLIHKTFVANFPWAKDEHKKQRQRDIDGLMSEWKRRFGDPNDPAVQSRFLKVAQAWRRQAEAAKKNQFADQRKLQTTLKKIMADRRTDAAKKARGK